MIRILLVLALMVAFIAGLGLTMGWFHVSSDNDANSTHVTVMVDKDQIQDDKDNVVDKVQDLEDQEKDKEVATTTLKTQ